METDCDAARKAYWAEQMDAAYAFMEGARQHPIEDNGESVVFLPDVVRDARLNVAFSTTPVGKGHERLFYLREGLVEEFVAVAREMNARGWKLKVEDAYRTQAIQTELARDRRVFDVVLDRVMWECDGKVPSPELMFRRLSALVATRPHAAPHMAASALDISVLRLDDGEEVDRGGPYIELSELTPMNSPFVSQNARENRREITAIMASYGFVAYPYEFWHYSNGDIFDLYLSGTKRPAHYGPVEIEGATGKTTPLDSTESAMHTFEDIRERIDQALKKDDKEGQED